VSWYVVVERSNIPEYNDTQWEDIVIGPFDTQEEAVTHMDDSLDVEDWMYGEAKAKQYNADGAFVTQNPDIPSYGVNAPILMNEGD
jgi:hypothetical protein